MKLEFELLQINGLIEYKIFSKDNELIFKLNKKQNNFENNITNNIKLVHDSKQIIRSFEFNGVDTGFKNIYPIFSNKGEYLGIFEITFSIEYLQNILEKTSRLHTHFLLNKKLINNNHNSYLVSNENNDYYDLNKNKKDEFDHFYLNQGQISYEMKKNKKFQIYYIDQEAKIISFLPIKNNLNQEIDFWLVSYTNDKLLNDIIKNSKILMSLMFIIILIISTLIYLSLESKKYLTRIINDKTDSIIKINKEIIQKDEKLVELNKELEKRVIRQNQEQNILLSLFDRGHSVIFKWINDENFTMEYVSKGVYDLCGYTTKDFYNNVIHYIDCIYPDDYETIKKEIKISIKNDYIKHKPYRIITKDKDIKWVSTFTLVIRDDDKNIVSYLCYINDITEDINREKLLIQKSKLEGLGEMIGNIAHQWRQPLSVITTIASGIKLRNEYI